MRINKLVLTLFLLPGTALYIVFVLVPIIGAFVYSFTDMRGVSADYEFIGLTNWIRMFADPRFFNSARVTVTFALMGSLFINIFALLIAFLLQIPRNKTICGAIRTMLFIPAVLTPVVMGFIWRFILARALPDILSSLGLPPMELLDFHNALGSLILVSVWMGIGVAMIIYTASLNNIPSELYEVSTIDGASRLQYFLRIAFPLIVPALSINLVNTIIIGFRQFDQIFAMTMGGPGRVTETMTLLIHFHAFQRIDFGYASALGFLLFAVVILISTTIIRFLRKREVDA